MVRIGAIAAVVLGGLAASAMAMQPVGPRSLQRILRKLGETPDNSRTDPAVNPGYATHVLQVPIDHFPDDPRYEPHLNGTFGLHYWYDDQWYQEGGPVFLLHSGEYPGDRRLLLMQKGILYELAKATGGLPIVCEHRFYGESLIFPNLTIEDFRWLTVEQAMADTAYFANNVKFAEFEHLDLSPQAVPWILYGGSYAGGLVAFLRTTFPDVFWGAISSSGVLEAEWGLPDYYQAHRYYSIGDCAITVQKLQDAMDNIWINQNGTEWPDKLKSAFGNFSDDRWDPLTFSSLISQNLFDLQFENWDPTVGDTGYEDFCGAITSDYETYNVTAGKREQVNEILTAGGYGDEIDVLTTRMLNWIGVIQEYLEINCDPGQSPADCVFGNSTDNSGDQDLSQYDPTAIGWPWQICTEWGYVQVSEGKRDGFLPMYTRLATLDVAWDFCQSFYNHTGGPDLDRINKYGGRNMSYPRLAFIGGERDPWRCRGVLALDLPQRESTTCEPVILIDQGVHRYDENGVFEDQYTDDFPPRPVQQCKAQEREFVKSWIEDWKKEHPKL